MTLNTVQDWTSETFTQADADRLEAASEAGRTIEVTISGVRFLAFDAVGAFALIDELAKGRPWRATVR